MKTKKDKITNKVLCWSAIISGLFVFSYGLYRKIHDNTGTDAVIVMIMGFSLLVIGIWLYPKNGEVLYKLEKTNG